MEQIGLEKVGTVQYSDILVNTVNLDLRSATIAGNQSLTLKKGYAMRDDPSNLGHKIRYTNAGGGSGHCILFEDVSVAVGDGNHLVTVMVGGNVRSAKVIDSTGTAVDATFKAALNNVRFD